MARTAGVSTATVSLVFSNHPRISAATRERVLRVAGELGYRPDPLVSAIAAQRWQTDQAHPGRIVAFAKIQKYRIPDPWHPTVEGAREEAARRGYTLQEFSLMDFGSARNFGRALYHRGIRGLVLGSVYDEDIPVDLPWEHFSAVHCGMAVCPVPLHTIMSNHFEAVELAVHKALASGHPTIGAVFIPFTPEVKDDRLRLGAYLACQRAHPRGRLADPLTVPNDARLPERVLAWYERSRPSLVIGHNRWILEILTEAGGWKCPEDFAFITLHREADDTDLAGLQVNDGQTGAKAVEVLDQLLRTNQMGTTVHPVLHDIQPDWMDGPSCPPCGRPPTDKKKESRTKHRTRLSRGPDAARAAAPPARKGSARGSKLRAG